MPNRLSYILISLECALSRVLRTCSSTDCFLTHSLFFSPLSAAHHRPRRTEVTAIPPVTKGKLDKNTANQPCTWRRASANDGSRLSLRAAAVEALA